MVKTRAGLTDTRASVTGGDMTAEAPSTASADESEQAVADTGERSATEWPTAESGSFSYLPHRNADSSPNGNGAYPPLSQYPDARVPTDQFRSADRATIAEELSYARQICSRHGWPLIDVTRRSIEETAAAIVALRGKAR